MIRSLHAAVHATRRLLLLAAAACLLLTGPLPAREPEAPVVGRLHITSDPPKATVRIDRQVRGETPLTIPALPAGTHLINIQKQGYLDAWQSVELLGQDSRDLDFKLEAITGLLLLQSAPTNADITIGGVALGRTPLLISTLPIGTHRIRVSTPGYQPKEVEVRLDDHTPVRKQVDLVSNSASLSVETDAEEANIRINGLDCGSSPCTVDRIPEGDVTIELRATGYAPLTHKIRLAAGETQKIKLPMTPLPAALKIVSLPDKARVYINNEPRGQTPLDLPALAPGKYRVRVEMEGYDPTARDIELARASTKIEEFRLVSNAGKLELITEPDRVAVFLDGRKVGETKSKPNNTTNISDPLAIEPIQAGEHELHLVRKGYTEARQKIVLEQGKTLPLQVKLVRRFIPDRLVVTTRGTEYRGVVDATSDDFIRLETAPGVMTMIPMKDVKYERAIREDGSLE
ncbi:MAG: PEGA domain-containing protein [Kiritimatiellia bacterium]